jgi:hypothetical protein
MSIWIDSDLCELVKIFVNKKWQDKHVKCYCRERSWQSSRFIQVSTILKDMDIHYELYLGKVQLHFEGKYRNEEYKSFLRYLREQVPSHEGIKWRRWQEMHQGLCEINYEINTEKELEEKLTKIINLFDPIIEKFVSENRTLFPNQRGQEVIPNLTYEIKEELPTENLNPTINCVGNIPFDKLLIPTYQRPYKWSAKNVNQLINDLITFSNKEQYRLGTLVLHKNEIVDGQQRIITLCLLITKILERIHKGQEKTEEKYKGIVSKLSDFSNKIKFENRYSLHNVVENLYVMDTRKDDFDESLLDFILQKCEFVVIQLSDISEAFQFFDSQNARGKDLEAHDLLKAYHLREIHQMTEADSQNIDIWQSQQTRILKNIFLTLFRAKRWSEGKSARYFTKDQVSIFKGISLKDGKRYPFYQMEVIAHIFTEMYANDPIRQIDQNHLEYPFNINDQIINGSRFFDMIQHYLSLYKKLENRGTYPEGGKAREIIDLTNDYEGVYRTGDRYVKNMFITLILYYVDKFGFEELDKVIPKFFIWAYTLRLESLAVQLASTDNYASEEDSMFRVVHDAKTPYDIININQSSLSHIECTKCERITAMFEKLNKYQRNE